MKAKKSAKKSPGFIKVCIASKVCKPKKGSNKLSVNQKGAKALAKKLGAKSKKKK